MSVTSSDPHSDGKTAKFVGICVFRVGTGLNSQFILRNCIDHQGIEVTYDIYDPTIQKIEVLRLEKRLDDNLFYLRDCLPEFSTIDLNMEPEYLPEGAAVPTNDIKVIMKPRPWTQRWDRMELKGVVNIREVSSPHRLSVAEKRAKPWEKFDLMKQYRGAVPEEEQQDIYSEVYNDLQKLAQGRNKFKRKKSKFGSE